MAKMLSLPELRNGSAAVMDAVERGETVIVTRDGHPVAELRPLKRRRFVPTAEVMLAFRDLPHVNSAAMRAEADALFGEELADD